MRHLRKYYKIIDILPDSPGYELARKDLVGSIVTGYFDNSPDLRTVGRGKQCFSSVRVVYTPVLGSCFDQRRQNKNPTRITRVLVEEVDYEE